MSYISLNNAKKEFNLKIKKLLEPYICNDVSNMIIKLMEIT